jgi:DNA-binding Lrp family transcriptional regulator
LKKVLLVKSKNSFTTSKEALLFDNPLALKPVVSPLGWEIIKLIANEESYPAEIARKLRQYRQKVYYYVKQLEKNGLIKKGKVIEAERGKATGYRLSSFAFCIELPYGDRPFIASEKVLNSKLSSFLNKFISKGIFDGIIVTGSPNPHGPNMVSARDGHYSAQIGLFLGQFCTLPNDFIVRLDVDVRAEKLQNLNMILIGGPGANLITADINKHLPIKFSEQNYWAGLIHEEKTFSSETHGLIANIANPFEKDKRIIVLAGIRNVGTKTAILALTNFYNKVLKDYEEGKDWACVVRGYDVNGDGKVDSVELVYSATK